MPRQQVPNSGLLSDTARLNLLTNGGFEIWQRGTGPFASGAWTADRWTIGIGGTSTISVSRMASTIASTGYSLQCTYTHAAGGYGQLNTYLGDMIPQLQGKTVSFSIHVKSPAAGVANARIIANSAIVNNKVNVASGIDETITVTGTLAASGITTLTLDVIFTGTGTYEVNDAMLVLGGQPADFVPLHVADDLARCLRYYQRWSGASTYVALGSSASTTQHYLMVHHLAPMAVAPTLTTSPMANLQLLHANLGSLVAPSAVVATNMGINTSFIRADTASAFNTTGSPIYLSFNGANGWLALEANP